MKIFLFGAIMAMVGTIALCISAYRQGWLDRLLQPRRPDLDGEKRIKAFINQVQVIANRKRSFAGQYQNPDGLAADFLKLSVEKANQFADLLEKTLQDEAAASNELRQTCSHVISSLSRKLNFSAKSEPMVSPTPKIDVQPPQVGQDVALDDFTYYAVRMPDSNQLQYLSGAVIKEAIKNGKKINIDFFIMGLAQEYATNGHAR